MPKLGPSIVNARLKHISMKWRRKNGERPQDVAEYASSESQQLQHPKQRKSLRVGLAVLGGRAAGALIRRLYSNSGRSIVGLIVKRVDPDSISQLANQLEQAFDRGERIHIEGRTLRLVLTQNPTGFNEMLHNHFSAGKLRHVLFVLNDNAADGRDVSWIWDVDFEQVVSQTATLVTTGRRALDLALRLKYIGMPQEEMITVPSTPIRAMKRRNGLKHQKLQTKKNKNSMVTETGSTPHIHGYGIGTALDTAVRQTPVGETLFIVPTYTGLLEIQRELKRRGLKPHFMEGRDS